MFFIPYFRGDGAFYYTSIAKLTLNRHLAPSRAIHNLEQCLILFNFARLLNVLVPYLGTTLQRVDPVQYFFVGQKHLYGPSIEVPMAIIP